jgi:hypothetical protein
MMPSEKPDHTENRPEIRRQSHGDNADQRVAYKCIVWNQ